MNNKIKIYISIFCIVTFVFFLNAPVDFPVGIIVRIEPGRSLRNVSLQLKQERVVRSRLVFEAFVILYGGEKHIISGDYLFEDKISVSEVARRISKGEGHLAPVKVTIPEGFTVEDIADTFASQFSSFNKNEFLTSARDLEGYLFPDTYFFFTNASAGDVLKSLTDNFNKKISTLEEDIKQSGKSKGDIIKMASLIEGEAKGGEDRDIISGILWRRLSINMPLQADASPETYKNKGLPEMAINNPGLSSIKSAIYPKSSPYLYYLHDKNGKVYYAKTFAEHQRNIVKYLK